MSIPYQRPISPYLTFDEKKNAIYITDEKKIHRIRSKKSFYAEVVSVISPSEIWIRVLNHVVDDLVVTTEEKDKLTKSENINVNDYVMAQYDDNTYARARILHIFDDDNGVLLRFIDHGIVVYRQKDDLYELVDGMQYYRWQTVLTALYDVHPLNGECWSREEICILKDVISKYQIFWVIPQKSIDFYKNDDGDPYRVLLNGISSANVIESDSRVLNGLNLGFSVIELYLTKLPPSIGLNIFDSNDQKLYPCENSNTFDDLRSDPLDVTVNAMQNLLITL